MPRSRKEGTILVAASEERTDSITRSLQRAGLRVTAFPTVRIEPTANSAELDSALRNWQSYDWVVFTSTNGVRAAAKRGRELRLDLRPVPPRIASVGPATAASLEAEGLAVAAMPDEFVTDAIPDVLGEVEGQRVLLLRSSLARESLAERLRKGGARVDEVEAYEARPFSPDLSGLPPANGIDLVVFTSSSTVRNLVRALPPDYVDALRTRAEAACIGPVTAESARECGFRIALVAGEHTAAGLVRAIREASP